MAGGCPGPLLIRQLGINPPLAAVPLHSRLCQAAVPNRLGDGGLALALEAYAAAVGGVGRGRDSGHGLLGSRQAYAISRDDGCILARTLQA
jgi:hypothetical protein